MIELGPDTQARFNQVECIGLKIEYSIFSSMVGWARMAPVNLRRRRQLGWFKTDIQSNKKLHLIYVHQAIKFNTNVFSLIHTGSAGSCDSKYLDDLQQLLLQKFWNDYVKLLLASSPVTVLIQLVQLVFIKIILTPRSSRCLNYCIKIIQTSKTITNWIC